MGDRELVRYLEGFVTKERRARMAQVLAERTRYVTVVLEDIYQPHNASAVLRTCDCFGIQDIHIVENRNEYRVNPGVELGTAQWLTLSRYSGAGNNTGRAVEKLRRGGYRIVATSPHADRKTPADLDLEPGPVALLFGTEMEGLSQEALDLADEHIAIPMFGFVESFNISVSAALVLGELSRRLRSSSIRYHLTDAERDLIYLGWIRSSIGRIEVIERGFRTGDSDQEQESDQTC